MAIFNGGAQLFYAFSHEAKHRWLEGLLGIIYIIAGIYLLMHPLGGLLAITLLVGSSWWFTACLRWFWPSGCGRLPGWGWVLFDAIVTVLLGVLIYIHWPAQYRVGDGHAVRHQLHRHRCVPPDALAGGAAADRKGGVGTLPPRESRWLFTARASASVIRIVGTAAEALRVSDVALA